MVGWICDGERSSSSAWWHITWFSRKPGFVVTASIVNEHCQVCHVLRFDDVMFWQPTLQRRGHRLFGNVDSFW